MESGSQSTRLPLGEDLVAGHVHARPSADTPGHAASPRVKRRLRSKTSLWLVLQRGAHLLIHN